MNSPKYWHEAKEYLTLKDPILAELIASYPSETMLNYYNPFLTLMKAIIGQQISVAAAHSISRKVENLLGSISINNYLEIDELSLRQCGLSRQKILYIRNVAQAFEEGILTPQSWETMSDQEITKQLTSIKGIGSWTAQMFLIFHLHRKDIFPMADLGLINAIQRHYGNTNLLTKEQIKELSQPWKPYRTVATWYLWRSLDPLPVQY
ncbi:putative DNA-3-methyladenine glycosylase II [Crocosphaera subtropica ATCC 51142]|uniref:DNA-3-methyladenine glycosylase II n=1 Tax=Crocosphaera subtropica (strain ATCC 51142 / BH68) TaxID=43989 RepID=B1WW25_CROS5|nr:DNA-3-methyladenine glycosylase [Crocosphaera subtropica]ACB52358.1 putative DNA-3-methyladenine glycosylase II [Crocosphaera subtropica ATCC 51142]